MLRNYVKCHIVVYSICFDSLYNFCCKDNFGWMFASHSCNASRVLSWLFIISTPFARVACGPVVIYMVKSVTPCARSSYLLRCRSCSVGIAYLCPQEMSTSSHDNVKHKSVMISSSWLANFNALSRQAYTAWLLCAKKLTNWRGVKSHGMVIVPLSVPMLNSLEIITGILYHSSYFN